ncbi:MAG: glutamine amidotransferase-related protein [Pirellula sp.]
MTHPKMNHTTNAAVRHKQVNAVSVQYHPEASAGPHDSSYLFDQFQSSLINATASH